MDWKETVMGEDGKRPCVFTDKGKYRTPWAISDKTAKAQAQITGDIAYKAGEVEMDTQWKNYLRRYANKKQVKEWGIE